MTRSQFLFNNTSGLQGTESITMIGVAANNCAKRRGCLFGLRDHNQAYRAAKTRTTLTHAGRNNCQERGTINGKRSVYGGRHRKTTIKKNNAIFVTRRAMYFFLCRVQGLSAFRQAGVFEMPLENIYPLALCNVYFGGLHLLDINIPAENVPFQRIGINGDGPAAHKPNHMLVLVVRSVFLAASDRVAAENKAFCR